MGEERHETIEDIVEMLRANARGDRSDDFSFTSLADRIEAAMEQEHAARAQTMGTVDRADAECAACDAAGCVTHAAPSYRALRDELARVASEIGLVCVTGVDDTTDGVVRSLLRQARLSLSDAVEFVECMMRAKENEP